MYEQQQEATTHNLVLAIYGFSKITCARDFLHGPTILIDKVLNRLGEYRISFIIFP